MRLKWKDQELISRSYHPSLLSQRSDPSTEQCLGEPWMDLDMSLVSLNCEGMFAYVCDLFDI